LRHAIAHRWHAARNLRRCPYLAGEELDLFGIAAIGLMRRQHVVVGGHNAYVHCPPAADNRLVALRCGEAVRKVAARDCVPCCAGFTLAGYKIKIRAAGGGRSFNDPVGYSPQDRVLVRRHAGSSLVVDAALSR